MARPGRPGGQRVLPAPDPGGAGQLRAFRAVAAVPWLLLGLVRALDRPDAAGMSMVEIGARDETAHQATSLIVLIALLGPDRLLRHPRETVTACAASSLIDLDHVPLFIRLPGVNVAVDGGRPFTHSAPTIGVLAGLAAASPRRRSLLLAAAGGVGLHFVRDIATGDGLPVWWPWERRGRRLPYSLYTWLLVGLAAVASARLLARRPQPEA